MLGQRDKNQTEGAREEARRKGGAPEALEEDQADREKEYSQALALVLGLALGGAIAGGVLLAAKPTETAGARRSVHLELSARKGAIETAIASRRGRETERKPVRVRRMEEEEQ